MTSHPKISIITPSYNQGHFIEETINSVLSQNYPNLEYIIIDGGSTDNTVEVIKKYEDRLTYWVSEPDQGQTDAINKGFKMATGEIINWLNSDDLLAPNTLITIANHFLENKHVGFVYGQIIEFDEEKFHPLTYFPKDDLPYRYFYEFPFAQPACFYKRTIVEHVGWLNEDFKFTMDLDLFVRILANYDALQINNVLAYFRWHDTSKSSTLGDIAKKEKIKVFSTLYRSAGFTRSINLLKELDLYTPMSVEYSITNEELLNNEFRIIRGYLLPFINRYYISGDYDKTRKIITFFKQNAPEYLNHPHLVRKIKMLRMPDFFIGMYRKLKN